MASHYEVFSCFLFFPPMSARNPCLGGVSGCPMGPGDLPRRPWFLRPTDVSQPGSTVGRRAASRKVAVTRAVPSARLPWGEEGACPPLVPLSSPGLGWSQRHTMRTVLLFLVVGVLPEGWVLHSLRSRRPGPPATQGPSAIHSSNRHEQPLKCLSAANRVSLCILGPCSPHGKQCQEQCLRDLLNTRVVSPNPENLSVPGPGKQAEWDFQYQACPGAPRGGRRTGGGWTARGLGSPLLKVQNTYQRPICISSESDTRTHPESTPSSHHGRGARLLLDFPQGARVTWPRPPAGGAPWRWRPCRTTRAAHAAVESSWGRRCG